MILSVRSKQHHLTNKRWQLAHYHKLHIERSDTLLNQNKLSLERFLD